jgi:hypothetical protein
MEFHEFRKDVIHFFGLEDGIACRTGIRHAAAFDADLEIISIYRVFMNLKVVKVMREDILYDPQAIGIKKLPYHCFVAGRRIDGNVGFVDFESVPVQQSAYVHIKEAEDAGCRPDFQRTRQGTWAKQINEKVGDVFLVFYFDFDFFALPGSFENGKHPAPEFHVYPAVDNRQKRGKLFLEAFGGAGERENHNSD